MKWKLPPSLRNWLTADGRTTKPHRGWCSEKSRKMLSSRSWKTRGHARRETGHGTHEGEAGPPRHGGPSWGLGHRRAAAGGEGGLAPAQPPPFRLLPTPPMGQDTGDQVRRCSSQTHGPAGEGCEVDEGTRVDVWGVTTTRYCPPLKISAQLSGLYEITKLKTRRVLSENRLMARTKPVSP